MTQANKLIDDIENIKITTQNDLRILQYNLNLLKSSVKFSLGEDTDLIKVGNFKNQKDVASEYNEQGLKLLPFDTCLFELSDTSNPKCNYFTLTHRIEHNKYLISPWDAFDITDWCYSPLGFFFIISFSDDTAHASISHLILDASENIVSNEEMMKTLAHFLQPVIFALRMMACSNIEIVDNIPSKLKQSRVKKGKTPLFTYKTLHITDAPKTKNKNGSGGTHSSPRVHLRRGHIRRLSEEKSVWVQPCVVGDKSKGVIHKDYKFTAS